MVTLESISLADIGKYLRAKYRERLIQANDPSIIIRDDCIFDNKSSAMKFVYWTNTTVDKIRNLIEEMKIYYSAPGNIFNWIVSDFDKPDFDIIKGLLVESGFINIIEEEELIFKLTPSNVKEISELYAEFQQSSTSASASFTIKELDNSAKLDKNIANITIQSFPKYFTNYDNYKQSVLETDNRLKLMDMTSRFYLATINEMPVGAAGFGPAKRNFK